MTSWTVANANTISIQHRRLHWMGSNCVAAVEVMPGWRTWQWGQSATLCLAADHGGRQQQWHSIMAGAVWQIWTAALVHLRPPARFAYLRNAQVPHLSASVGPASRAQAGAVTTDYALKIANDVFCSIHQVKLIAQETRQYAKGVLSARTVPELVQMIAGSAITGLKTLATGCLGGAYLCRGASMRQRQRAHFSWIRGVHPALAVAIISAREGSWVITLLQSGAWWVAAAKLGMCFSILGRRLRSMCCRWLWSPERSHRSRT